jgi:transcriptional regulator with XRE-family HTH domain
MNDQRLGAILRAVRLRAGLTQQNVADRAGVSRSVISRIERGHLETVSLGTLRRVSAALEVRIEAATFSRNGDLDRLVNARHSALDDALACHLRGLPDWTFGPEVSFAIWGERGLVDILAWQPRRRMLLVIELKTAIVDVNELAGTFDRKMRLAIEIARRHGWAVPDPTTVSGWVVVSDTRTNRRRVAQHAAMLRAAFPSDGRTIRGWLARPTRQVRCLSFWHEPAAAPRDPARCAPTGHVARSRAED